MSGGATMEEMRHRSPQRATEVFVEFDHRHPAAGGAPPFMYSYGERLAVDTVDSFDPFVQRAEKNALAHQATDGRFAGVHCRCGGEWIADRQPSTPNSQNPRASRLQVFSGWELGIES